MKLYSNCKIQGPYKRPDNRLHMIITYPNRPKTTVSYPKFLMEQHLGRYFKKNETVDHIDRNPLNNDLSNLQILMRSDHAKLDVVRRKEQIFICPFCKKTFTLSGKNLYDAQYNYERNKSGPYCSRSCSGKASHIKGGKKLTKVKVEYYSLKGVFR